VILALITENSLHVPWSRKEVRWINSSETRRKGHLRGIFLDAGCLTMTQTEEHPPSLDGVLSQRADVQLVSLLAVKDDIIGHPLRKAAYVGQKLVPALLQVLRSAATSADVRVEAIIVLGSLCHGKYSPEQLNRCFLD
jgi:hypothetical protein